MNIAWNAEIYQKNFSFVPHYGEGVIELIDFRKGMKLLDLGCGNGVLTKRLKDMGAEVVGIDASKEMLEAARRNYPDIPFYEKDASHFAMEEKFDVVFSNAVFHWIDNQEGLLNSIAGVLRQGGQLVCEFGGYGNCGKIHGALARAFESRGLEYRRTFYFPSIGEYAALCERSGLRPSYAVLFDRKTPLSGENGMLDWINMFVKTPFAGLDAPLAEELKQEAVEALKGELYQDGVWYADYVRLRLKAALA